MFPQHSSYSGSLLTGQYPKINISSSFQYNYHCFTHSPDSSQNYGGHLKAKILQSQLGFILHYYCFYYCQRDCDSDCDCYCFYYCFSSCRFFPLCSSLCLSFSLCTTSTVSPFKYLFSLSLYFFNFQIGLSYFSFLGQTYLRFQYFLQGFALSCFRQLFSYLQYFPARTPIIKSATIHTFFISQINYSYIETTSQPYDNFILIMTQINLFVQIQMRKVPSYPKITAKTNITVTQTQNININSPKNILQKKGFKQDSKKIKLYHNLKNESESAGIKPLVEPMRKSSNKLQKDEKSIKDSKSKRELMILSEKLKKLEEKIRVIKTREKKQIHASSSTRSLSKTRENRDNSAFVKKQVVSSRKDFSKNYNLIQDNKKALKKSYSDKLGFKVPSTAFSKTKIKKCSENMKQIQQESNEEQILHQFVTQVPNNHPHNPKFKESVEQSLRNRTYEMSCSSESEEEADLYYIGKAVKSLVRTTLFSVREHLIQSLQTLQFLQNIRKPTLKQIQKRSVKLPQSKFAHTVILDLDETLIHCNQTLSLPHDVKLTIKFPTGEKIDAGVNIRPYAKQFLEELSQMTEVIVFTASHQCYANVVLDYLDPKRKLISHRLFRQHCWQTEEGIYIKDLRVVQNRSLENMVLVDNAAYSYFYQLENGVPIIPYYDEKDDKQLILLLAYLKEMISSSEKKKTYPRMLNAKYFKLQEYVNFDDIGPLVQKLYRQELIDVNH